MKSKCVTLIFAILILLSLKTYAQDIISKNDGTDIMAKVLEISDSNIKYKKYEYPEGPTYSLHTSEILKIRYENGTEDMFSNQPRNKYKTHDGFYLSMALGGSFLSINNDITNGTNENVEMTGAGGIMDLKIGIALSEHFILHGDMIYTSSSSAKVVVDGRELGTISGDNSIGMTLIGAGTTYYFLPSNIFISGSIGAGEFFVTTNDNTINTQTGFGLYLKVGKEWWISKNWGLGFNAGFNYTNVINEVDNMTEKLSGTSISLSINATLD